MRFSDKGPDIPENLIRAQLAGDVVFVVGAGVSRHVGLPLFNGLVARVYDDLGQIPPGKPNSLSDKAETEAWKNNEWDRALGLLEQRIVYPDPSRPENKNPVRETVSKILKLPHKKLNPHKDILSLSRDTYSRPRVVTTNFDTLLEQSWSGAKTKRPLSFSGPGLPAVGAPEFHGVLHLHGRISNDVLRLASTDLVLTSADFGEAYLRSGWASRFVYDLLRRYTLIFVGYAADDPPMRYMLEATEAGRQRFPDLKHPYAFVDYDEKISSAGDVRAFWRRAKGLMPILFENSDGTFNNLYHTLSKWAAFSKNPAKWAEREIIKSVNFSFAQSPSETRDKVRFLSKFAVSSKILSKHAKNGDWIECLIDRENPPHLENRDAFVWFIDRMNDHTAISWLLNAGHIIKSIVIRELGQLLSIDNRTSSTVFDKFWHLCVVESQDSPEPHLGVNWGRLSRKLRSGEADYFVTRAITNIFRPRLYLKPLRNAGLKKLEKTPPQKLNQLCQVEFRCEDWPSHTDVINAWPKNSDSEFYFLSILHLALEDICDLAFEAEQITPEFDLTSYTNSMTA